MPSTYTPIATYTVSGSTTNTVTFSSIPQTYTDIVMIMNVATTTGTTYPTIRLNNDSSTLYSRTQLYGNGSAASSDRATGEPEWYFTIGNLPTAANTFSSGIVHLFNYTNTTTFKTALNRSAETSIGWVGSRVSLYRSTSAITRIDFLTTANYYAAGSTFTLYGVKSA